MDNLPKFLIKAIRDACEEFPVITYTVHGDDQKARISIMFSMSENKQVKRKSASTGRRDNKRMKEFNDNKCVENGTFDSSYSVSNTRNDTLNVNENTNIKTFNSANTNDSSMEFESDPVCASLPLPEVETIGENIEHSINSTVDLNDSEKSIIETAVDVHNQMTIETGLNNTEKVLNSKSVNSKQCDLTVNTPRAIWKDVVFEKIVLKKSRMEADRLIGKCSNGRLITYNIHQKIIDIMDENSGRFEWYLQCVETDFKDVRETTFYTDEMRMHVERIQKYLKRLMN